MDIQSRRAATIMALAQVGATFVVYMMATFIVGMGKREGYVWPFAERSQTIALCLLAIPFVWLFLVLYLQDKGKEIRLAILFYAGYPYVIFLLLWAARLFSSLFMGYDKMSG